MRTECREALMAPNTLVAMACWLICGSPVRAHEGPPFPILMDVPVASHAVSVWADPDIGEATFFIILESANGGPATEEPVVSMWVEPVDGRLDRVAYDAHHQSVKSRSQFEAKPQLDQRDTWNVGFRLEFPGREPMELTAHVESTPPGFGPWGLLVYFAPFTLVGGLWVAAVMRMRRLRQEAMRQRSQCA